MNRNAVVRFHGFADGADFAVNAGNLALKPLWVQVGNQLANNLLGAAETHIEGNVQDAGWGRIVSHGQGYLLMSE
jgi:hypothetical protein